MKNENAVDRVVRFVLGAGLGALAWFSLGLGAGEILGIVVGAVGLILIGTSLAGFCPLYRVLGIRTCKLPEAPKEG